MLPTRVRVDLGIILIKKCSHVPEELTIIDLVVYLHTQDWIKYVQIINRNYKSSLFMFIYETEHILKKSEQSLISVLCCSVFREVVNFNDGSLLFRGTKVRIHVVSAYFPLIKSHAMFVGIRF